MKSYRLDTFINSTSQFAEEMLGPDLLKTRQYAMHTLHRQRLKLLGTLLVVAACLFATMFTVDANRNVVLVNEYVSHLPMFLVGAGLLICISKIHPISVQVSDEAEDRLNKLNNLFSLEYYPPSLTFRPMDVAREFCAATLRSVGKELAGHKKKARSKTAASSDAQADADEAQDRFDEHYGQWRDVGLVTEPAKSFLAQGRPRPRKKAVPKKQQAAAATSSAPLAFPRQLATGTTAAG